MPRETTHVLMPDEIEQLVVEAIRANGHANRMTDSQAAVDRAVAIAYREGDVQLAAMLLVVEAACVANDRRGLLTVLMQYACDQKACGRWTAPTQ